MSTERKHRHTLDEYFALERDSEIKYEYFNGEVFATGGASPNHNDIVVNILLALGERLKGRPCRVMGSDQKVKVPAAPPYRYPDVVVTCGKREFEKMGGMDALVNAELIVEVLSPATEAYDRGDKFSAYQSIPSFKEYLLVAQHRPHVSQYVKEGDRWVRMEFNSLNAEVYLYSTNFRVTLDEIYRDIEFETE